MATDLCQQYKRREDHRSEWIQEVMTSSRLCSDARPWTSTQAKLDWREAGPHSKVYRSSAGKWSQHMSVRHHVTSCIVVNHDTASLLSADMYQLWWAVLTDVLTNVNVKNAVSAGHELKQEAAMFQVGVAIAVTHILTEQAASHVQEVARMVAAV